MIAFHVLMAHTALEALTPKIALRVTTAPSPQSMPLSIPVQQAFTLTTPMPKLLGSASLVSSATIVLSRLRAKFLVQLENITISVIH
jgi:hypothetical protein